MLSPILTSITNAELVGWWRLDEGSGTTASDSSGNENDATFEGSPAWVASGKFGGALEFNGTSDYLAAPDSESLDINGDQLSITAWINGEDWPAAEHIVRKIADAAQSPIYVLRVQPDSVRVILSTSAANTTIQGTTALTRNEWVHVAVTYDGAQAVIYVDGQVDAAVAVSGQLNQSDNELRIGRGDPGGYFIGMIDDVRLYNHALTEDELLTAMETIPAPPTLAAEPNPANEAIDIPRDVVLSWTPGESANTHDVYFGTSLDDVNDASADDPRGVLVSQGQTETSYAVGILDFGQTYYWRVDEVNSAPDNTVFKGAVWRFEVEPFSIPVTNITATASSAHDADMVPERTIDGSGLGALDQHSNEPRHMWLSGMGDPTPSIQYEFDMAYKLHELWVWNSNQAIESFIGLGAKDVTIETSTNGADWTQLEEIPPFAQAPGQAAYAHNTVIDLGGVVAQYVRLTIDAGYGMLPQSGLSEVRFLYIPTNAREAQPADGDTTDTVDVALTWRAGREAASHEVYLGTDPDALALAATLSDKHYSPTDLNYATTYYWQIVEVNDAEDPAAHAGPVWSFSTAPYGIVDDFDQYNDNCERIFFAWEDGLGHNGGEDVDNCDVAPSNGNGGGSIVGHAQSPFAERTIVHSGSQSLPLEYDNAFGPSEATLSFDSQDWTAHNIKSLSLFFRGDPANTGQLYVKINNTKVSYDGLADALQRDQWTPWNIDLSAVGGNLQAVTGLTIGVDGATAAGMLYVDDIRLYPLAPEVITPVDPGAANLVAYYPFDGDYQDASGNNRHGAPVGGDPSFAPGVQGQALNLNAVTITEHIDIAGYKGIVADQTDPDNPVQAAFTVACWINTIDNGSLVFWGSGDGAPVGGQYQNFRIDGGRLRSEHGNGRFRGASTVNDGEWHHVALAVDTGTNMVPPGTRIFVDGMQDAEGADTANAQNIWNITADVDMAIGARTTAGDRLFVGLLDEVRVYDRALTNGEIASLAGLAQAFDRPFD